MRTGQGEHGFSRRRRRAGRVGALYRRSELSARSRPRSATTAWKLISHLSLNYLSLVERRRRAGAEMLRELLALYADPNDAAVMRQIEGVRGVSYQPGRAPHADRWARSATGAGWRSR